MTEGQSEELTELATRVARLERRLKRERSAREEAEHIADKGMRDLWLANRELDQRVAERTADLEDTLQQLEKATTARDQFLSTLSHEMRTPLNGVLGMLELLEPHIATEQGLGYLVTVSESAARLNNLIARLLDIVELNSGGLIASLERISPDELLAEILERWQRPALLVGHLLTTTSYFPTDTLLEVDVARVHQIVGELIDNALNHSDPGSLQVRLAPHDAGLVVEVEDSGPGLSAEQVAAVFVDQGVDMSAARATDGLGLGLGLSRKIAHALGGDLSLESGEANGCVAKLVLPSAA